MRCVGLTANLFQFQVFKTAHNVYYVKLNKYWKTILLANSLSGVPLPETGNGIFQIVFIARKVSI